MSAVLELLRSVSEHKTLHLYALVDAGRHSDVLTLLYSFDVQMRSLYDGESEARLGASGPYLVELSDDDDLLKSLLRMGWGQAWGVYLTSDSSFEDVRKHFRKLLMVKRQSDASEMYFRFYDPRVLRVFLPTCSPDQVRAMFGPVTAYYIESDDRQPMRFTTDDIEGRTASDA